MKFVVCDTEIDTKELLLAATVRAVKTFFQTLFGSGVVGVAITPAMIQNADISTLTVILAWFLSGLFAALSSFGLSIAAGIPEVGKKVEE